MRSNYSFRLPRAVVPALGGRDLQAANPGNHVSLSDVQDEFSKRRAFVSITPTANDLETWDAMDHASDQVRKVFADVAGAVDIPGLRRDGLGTTHHEAGTLWMGIS